MGAFSNVPNEISFKNMVSRLREIRSIKIVINHIEEIELNAWGEKHFNAAKRQHNDVKFDYACDGMKIKL